MPAPHVERDLLTPADAARILGLSVDMVRILATNGHLATAARTARGARLFRREDVEELAGTRAGQIVRHHSVQFYQSEGHLAAVVAGFMGDGMRGGAGAIVIATERNRRNFVSQLRTSGFAVDDAIESRQLVLLEARATLSAFMIDGEPDEERFRAHVGSLVAQMRERWPRARLRVYGEMVDLLWKDGLRESALAVEDLWNRIAATQSFSILCAYSIRNFPAARDGEAFDRICSVHTRVVPTELFHQDDDIDQRLREIARLQQRAHALECEIAAHTRNR